MQAYRVCLKFAGSGHSTTSMSTEPIPEAFDTILVLDFGSQYVREPTVDLVVAF